MSESLDFWFDFNSPWCYLAGEKIGDIARQRGLVVRWRPIHLANLIDAVDGRRPLESGGRLFFQDVNTYMITAGLEGEFDAANRDFYWDLTAGYGDNRGFLRRGWH